MLTANARAASVALTGQVYSERRTGLGVAQDRLTGQGLRDLSVLIRLAPEFGMEIARRPELADEIGGKQPKLVEAGHGAVLRLVTEVAGFDDGMRAARRYQQALALRTVSQFVLGQAGRTATAAGLSDLADGCVAAMAELAEMQVRRRYGPMTSRWAVCGLGKLGGRDMTATSDVDLVFIYDAEDVEAQRDAHLFVKTLVHALSHRDETGRLYETDMRLRPHGEKGAAAVQLSAFEHYHASEAWTWERMALTRLRPICGDAELCERIVGLKTDVIAEHANDKALTQDVAHMRERLSAHRAAESFWDMKFSEGGLVDIEFIVQHAMLTHADVAPEIVVPNTADALDALHEHGILSDVETQLLKRAEDVQATLQQAQRATRHARSDDVETADEAWQDWFCNQVGALDVDDCRRMLADLRNEVVSLRRARLSS